MDCLYRCQRTYDSRITHGHAFALDSIHEGKNTIPEKAFHFHDRNKTIK